MRGRNKRKHTWFKKGHPFIKQGDCQTLTEQSKSLRPGIIKNCSTAFARVSLPPSYSPPKPDHGP